MFLIPSDEERSRFSNLFCLFARASSEVDLKTCSGKPGGLWYLFQSSSRVVSQVFDNTPAALEGTLAAGDEITGVNGKPVKGKTKVEVAKMIQAVQVRLVQQSTTAPSQSTVAFSCELSSTGMA